MISVKQLPQSGVSGEEYLRVLFESVTLEQLKLVLALLTPADVEVPSCRTRKDAVQHIWSTGRSRADVVSAVLELEAKSAMKHCFVGRLNTPDAVSTLCAAPNWSELALGGIGVRFARIEYSDSLATITLEHFVLCRDWKLIDDVTKVVEERLARHPLVIRFDLVNQIATVSYPGYSQGSATKPADRTSYEDLVQAFLSGIRAQFQVSISALPIGAAIQALQDSESSRIRVVSADMVGKFGRMMLSSDDDSMSVNNMLAELLGAKASISRNELEEIVNSALKNTSSSGLVAIWRPENVLTRIKFWAEGCEFLFVWNGVDASLKVVLDIVGLVTDIARSITRDGSQSVWTAIAEMTVGEVVTPLVLSQRSNSDHGLATSTLLRAMQAALVEPVFRVKTSELLDGFGQRWTRDLNSIRRRHSTDSGVEIDGSDERNIEVGFKRLGRELVA